MTVPVLNLLPGSDHTQAAFDYAVEHGMHAFTQYLGMKGRLEMLAPCKMLVIGGGLDVPLYCLANRKASVHVKGVGGGAETVVEHGHVVVFEQDEQWRGKIIEACEVLPETLRPTVLGIDFKTLELGEAAAGLGLDKIVWDIVLVDPPRDERFDAHRAALKWAFNPARRDKHTWIIYTGHEQEAIRTAGQGLNGQMTTAVWKSMWTKSKPTANNTVWGVYGGHLYPRPRPAVQLAK